MRDLVPKQRAVVWVAILVGIGFFCYPPTGRASSYGRNEWYGYVFLFDRDMRDLVTDWPRLLFQYVILGVVTWFATSGIKPGTRSPEPCKKSAVQPARQSGAAKIVTPKSRAQRIQLLRWMFLVPGVILWLALGSIVSGLAFTASALFVANDLLSAKVQVGPDVVLPLQNSHPSHRRYVRRSVVRWKNRAAPSASCRGYYRGRRNWRVGVLPGFFRSPRTRRSAYPHRGIRLRLSCYNRSPTRSASPGTYRGGRGALLQYERLNIRPACSASSSIRYVGEFLETTRTS